MVLAPVSFLTDSPNSHIILHLYEKCTWIPQTCSAMLLTMLIDSVLTTITRVGMVRPLDRVLIGVSGGADSVTLSHVLTELRATLEIDVELAHLHHGLRPEADDDEAFCGELAEQLGLPFTSERVDVASLAARSKRSLEEQGRLSRYRFLAEQAARRGCTRIAVAHTMNDQAETFLMRALRGSGARGLGSMRPVTNERIRPLIELRREEILAFLREHELDYRDDASNRDLRFTRNRLRHDILPRLSELNPQLVETLARNAEILRDEEDFMEKAARVAFDELASADRKSGQTITLSVEALATLQIALKRRVLRRAVEVVRGHTRNLSQRHVEDVLSLLDNGKSGREIHLPGLVVARSFDRLSLSSGSGRSRRKHFPNGYNRYEYRLRIPAELPILERQGVLTAHLAGPIRSGDEPLKAAGNAVMVGVEGGARDLVVRSPRSADRFRPLGAPGAKSLARYLMDRKVAKEERQQVPLVVRPGSENRRDDILWVVGHGVAETARLGTGRVHLRLEWVSQ